MPKIKKQMVKRAPRKVIKNKKAAKEVHMSISDLRADLKNSVASVAEGASVVVIHHYGHAIAKVVPL